MGAASKPRWFWGVVIERASYRTAFALVAGITSLALGLMVWVLRQYGTTFAGTEGMAMPGDD